MVDNSGFPIRIARRATYILPIQYLQSDEETPVDLTGYTAKMQFRSTTNSTGSAIISVSTTDGNILINGPLGTITVTIPSSLTNLDTGLIMVYDLFTYSPTGIATRLLWGNANVEGSVTV